MEIAVRPLLSHSNSFGFEMEKDAAGCRALNRNYYCRRRLYRISALTSQQNKNLVLYAAQMMIYAKNSKKGQKSILKFMFWEPSIMCRSSCKPQTYS